MNSEKWDILTADGHPTGRTTLRGKCVLKNGEYHLVVHIWIVSQNGRFLIQRRSDDKKLMPGEWAATGGAAIAGESSFEAASRELYEELGITSDSDTLTRLCRMKRRNSLLDIWVITVDTPAEQLTLQKSEVAEVKWIDRKDLEQMISSGKFHNYGKEYFETVFGQIEEHRRAVV